MLATPILIIDLDNTIYPVKSIGDELFGPLFDLLQQPQYNIDQNNFDKAKEDIMRVSFQKVARKYNFPEDAVTASLELLRNTTYNRPMETLKTIGQYARYPVQNFLSLPDFRNFNAARLPASALKLTLKRSTSSTQM